MQNAIAIFIITFIIITVIIRILTVAFYGCATWSLILKKEYMIHVFENMVLGKILLSSLDKITGNWRRLHNEKLYALYSSPNIIRVMKSRIMRWVGNVASMRERRGVNMVLVSKPGRKRQLEIPSLRENYNIEMGF
jgi:hypothetical protein